MRRQLRRAGALLTLIAVAALGAAAITGASAAKTKKVEVGDNFFAPTSVRIHKGDSVKWVWRSDSSQPHNVTKKRGPGGNFASAPSATYPYTYKHRFRKRGRYKVYCTIHPGTMKMTVRVRR